MSLSISTAVRSGEELVPGTCRKQYFSLAVQRGAILAVMCGCLTAKAHIGSFSKADAKKETDRLQALMKFGDGKLHTAAHGITKRLYAAFPELGKSVKHFPRLLQLSPFKLPKEVLATTSLFGFLTKMFDESDLSIADCLDILERSGL